MAKTLSQFLWLFCGRRKYCYHGYQTSLIAFPRRNMSKVTKNNWAQVAKAVISFICNLFKMAAKT